MDMRNIASVKTAPTKYPKYTWDQDLRRKVHPGLARCFRALKILGFTTGRLSRLYNLPEATIRYWLNRDKEKARIRRCYHKQKALGTLKKKPQARIRKCLARKKIICPSYKQWQKEYREAYMDKNKEKMEEFRRRWHEQHPGYMRDYMKMYNRRKKMLV